MPCAIREGVRPLKLFTGRKPASLILTDEKSETREGFRSPTLFRLVQGLVPAYRRGKPGNRACIEAGYSGGNALALSSASSSAASSLNPIAPRFCSFCSSVRAP
jgi:hypothetical protein